MWCFSSRVPPSTGLMYVRKLDQLSNMGYRETRSGSSPLKTKNNEFIARFLPQINDIKAHYIYPTLEYFTHNTEDEAHSVDKSSVMYGVVVYRTAQAMPGTCCSTFGPFASAQKLINAIDGLILTGGKSESYANMAEGMAVAMQCFEDFAADRNSQRGNSNASPAKAAQKYCIMICNSAPYSMPVPLVGQPFDMKNFEQLAVLFHEVSTI